MSKISHSVFPGIDAAVQSEITDEQGTFFCDNGLLLIRNVLCSSELKALQDQTYPLYQRAVDEMPDDPDYLYAKHEQTGQRVPFRIEYIIDKTQAGKALLGHPFILRSIEKLQGRNLIPTWDSMVFKKEGMGKAIAWHRDAAPYAQADVDPDVAAINVDFYLDGSDLTNCLWGVPGSNHWDADRIAARLKEMNRNFERGEFMTPADALPIPVNPGDVLFHNVLALHGSPPAKSRLRRVIYYEFRPAEVESKYGPHTREYLPLKQKVLLACQRHRAASAYAQNEKPFVYNPSSEFAARWPETKEELETYRYSHQEYWRK